MASELAVDTNVFAHCYDPRESRCDAALAIVTALRMGAHMLCVDEGFHVVESQNRSKIGSEYIEHLRAGSVGLTLVAFLASSGRVKIVPRRPPLDLNKRLVRLVSDPGDRAFVGVAWHSASRILVSHDFQDFPDSVRDTIAREIGVDIIDAASCLPRLA